MHYSWLVLTIRSCRYKNTKLHVNADGQSRLLLHSKPPEEESDPADLFYANQFEPLPVTAEQVKRETQRDPLLLKVHDLVMKGWWTQHDEEIKPFYQRKDELTVHCGVLMLGHRVVIPVKLRNQVLTELHEGHVGIVKMKSLARSYIWWPKIEKDVEHLAKSCPGCQLQALMGMASHTLAENSCRFCWTVPYHCRCAFKVA